MESEVDIVDPKTHERRGWIGASLVPSQNAVEAGGFGPSCELCNPLLEGVEFLAAMKPSSALFLYPHVENYRTGKAVAQIRLRMARGVNAGQGFVDITFSDGNRLSCHLPREDHRHPRVLPSLRWKLHAPLKNCDQLGVATLQHVPIERARRLDVGS